MSLMMDAKQKTPVELRAPKDAVYMEIEWADGHTGQYPHEILRGFCPCAECQGHTGPVQFVSGPLMKMNEIEEVGNYALRFTWEDAHSSGIFSFKFLRELCSCSNCCSSNPTDRTFER